MRGENEVGLSTSIIAAPCVALADAVIALLALVEKFFRSFIAKR
jgi:hypothetical protein